VLIPGDMGTESYLLHGTRESEETFGSTCHGAGRVLSRHQALKKWRGEQVVKKLRERGIYVHPKKNCFFDQLILNVRKCM